MAPNTNLDSTSSVTAASAVSKQRRLTSSPTQVTALAPEEVQSSSVPSELNVVVVESTIRAPTDPTSDRNSCNSSMCDPTMVHDDEQNPVVIGETATNEKNVGILAIEFYSPNTYIKQSELEKHMNVPTGKYTVGLGQDGLAVTGDAEDINSISLTVVHALLEKYDINPNDVGRLEVGTETLIDKSKSTKTVLMDLFDGNSDIEGATVVNACYGGTAALLNAFCWCESDAWDGRYAIVVAADIATYADGPARPTCGAGAVAVLVGRDAPIAYLPHQRATHSSNVWDFFKPDPSVEYPTVDGALSQVCYFRALEDVYTRFVRKMERTTEKYFDAKTPDYFVFHAPYNKLVQKSYARLFLLDARRRYSGQEEEKKDTDTSCDEYCSLHEWLNKPIEHTYNDKVLEGELKKLAAESFDERLTDANFASKNVGNTYTASVFFGLASLVDRAGSRGDLTPGKSIVMFSYGSGALATMYGLKVREPQYQTKFTVDTIVQVMDLSNRIQCREEVQAHELDLALNTRERMHKFGAPYSPLYPTVGRMLPGTYFLTGIDSQWRRTYARVPLQSKMEYGGSLAPPSVLRIAELESATSGICTFAQSVETKRRMACVITGTAAGLPGGSKVFQSDNLDRLVRGVNCITPLPTKVQQAMVEKNLVQVKKMPDGTMKKISLDKAEEIINLAAQLGKCNLTELYGIPERLLMAMDYATQVAIGAGMEAMKNAGLVSGKSNDPKEWMVPEALRDTTGIIFASSFPAMDSIASEIMRFLRSRDVATADSMRLVTSLRDRMASVAPEGRLSDEDEAAFFRLLTRSQELDKETATKTYEYDRKLLFRVLCLGNAQLAQLTGCRGPNVQTNAACAGTTQAIGMAQDMLMCGRADRVIVIAGDNASGPTLMPWLGSGFRVLGAATKASVVEEAALPFDKRRSGMIMGSGAIGIVLETEQSAIHRQNLLPQPFEVKARLVATLFSNSAYHGAALDRKHIASELRRFLDEVELVHGITMSEIAENGVYFSHETSTHASDASSCSGNEIAALRSVFGNELFVKLLILNTKGYFGHPMGVSFEDVAAVEVLLQQTVPAVPNYRVKDDYLGDMNISKGGAYPCRYALRFAAGFGSQVTFALYSTLH